MYFKQVESNIIAELKLRAQGKKLALCEAFDPRVTDAAKILQDEFGVIVTLCDNSTAKKNSTFTLDVIKKNMQKRQKTFSQEFHDLANTSLYEGGGLLSRNLVDAVVGGCCSPTADVIKASLNTIGLKDSTQIITSAFLLCLKHPTEGGESLIVFSDCAVLPEPTTTQLVDIAFLAQEAYEKWVFSEPKIAFLSYSTNGSAMHQKVTKIKDAVTLFKQRFSSIVCDGEIQFDAAVSPQVSEKKFPNNSLQGRANVLIFPNLEAGNIGYKIAQRLGGAQAWGPVLLGSQKPFSDLSRGASVADIVHTALLTLALF
ncbi:MAG: hypothetical protein K2X39_03690 [Silvanigrellaceae bacterium]|nr:hypothetical protein [Silvanigrellaceae bacterium]